MIFTMNSQDLLEGLNTVALAPLSETDSGRDPDLRGRRTGQDDLFGRIPGD